MKKNKPESARGKFCEWKATFSHGFKLQRKTIVLNIGGYTADQAFDSAHCDRNIPDEVRSAIRDNPYNPHYKCRIDFVRIDNDPINPVEKNLNN